MALHFHDKVPHLRTSLDVLEAEGVVGAIRLGPDDESILLALVDVGRANGAGEEDVGLIGLAARDETGGLVVETTRAECSATVGPAGADKLVYLEDSVRRVC